MLLDNIAFQSALDSSFGFGGYEPESPKRKQPLTTPIMVRMDQSMKADLYQVAKANGLSISDIVRLACRLQMPRLKAGETALAKPSAK